jgi:WD40 repeat protein
MTLKNKRGWVYSLAVLPNGNLVSGSDDKTIEIWL